MAQPGASVQGLVLAGGDSRRMGTDKAALRVAGQTLLERAVAEVAAVTVPVFVSARPDQAEDPLRAGFRLILDRWPDRGPAGGILSAHLEYPDAAWLVVACDMPRLDSALLAPLLANRHSAADCVAYMRADGDGPEPLCAVYEPATLADFARSMDAGDVSGPRAWLERAEVVLLEPPAGGGLENANTRQEYRSLVAAGRGSVKPLRRAESGASRTDQGNRQADD